MKDYLFDLMLYQDDQFVSQTLVRRSNLETAVARALKRLPTSFSSALVKVTFLPDAPTPMEATK